jgi:hypothetical protein
LLHCSPQVSIDDFIYTFRDYESLLDLSEPITTSCSQVCYEFQTSLKMFNKFDTIWQKLSVKDLSMKKSCEEKLKRMGWLIYIVSKQYIFERLAGHNMHGNHSLPEFAFLILATLHLLVVKSNP